MVIGSILHGAYGDYYEQALCLKHYRLTHPETRLELFFASPHRKRELEVFDWSFAAATHEWEALAERKVDGFIQYQVRDAELRADVLDKLPASVRAQIGDEQRHVAADDRPAAHEPLARVEQVHGAAAPADAPRAASEELRHGATRVAGAREVVRVLAIRGDDVVGRRRGRDRAHCDGLLPDVQMQEAADLSLRVRPRGGFLEAPAQGHLPIQVEKERSIHGE